MDEPVELTVTVNISEEYRQLWERVSESEQYDGPDEFEEWVRNHIARNEKDHRMLSSAVEEGIFLLHQQVQASASG